jgi:tight adherence protein B
MIGMVAAGLAGWGAYLLWSCVALGRKRLLEEPGALGTSYGVSLAERIGLRPGEPRRLALPTLVSAAVAAGVGFVVFAGVAPAVAIGGFAAAYPWAALRARRRRRLEAAAEGWPGMLEQLRLLTGSAGRSIPQALIEVGRRAPEDLRDAFRAAEREWLLSTDFERMIETLKDGLADPTADVVGETLLVAYEVGGSLDRQLADLVEDRLVAQAGRKDALSKQAGVRFARIFVLLVPVGMALAGLSIGSGRAAYQGSGAQLAVVAAVAAVVVCWWWAGKLLALPDEPRVFTAHARSTTR